MIDRIRHQGLTLEEWLRRPEINWSELQSLSSDLASLEMNDASRQQVEIETK